MKETSAAAQRTRTKSSLTAKSVMQKPVIAATPGLRAMSQISSLTMHLWQGQPDGRVIGVISESDIVRTLLEGKQLETLTAGEVMTGPPVTVDIDTPIDEVMKSLQENRIVRVPVTAEGKLVGIISRRDVIKGILEPEFIQFGDLSSQL